VLAKNLNLQSDNERLDCGHYEYLSRAFPTPDGFLICTECHASVTRLSDLEPRHDTSTLERLAAWPWLIWRAWITRKESPNGAVSSRFEDSCDT
jgi:hypothetical protein